VKKRVKKWGLILLAGFALLLLFSVTAVRATPNYSYLKSPYSACFVEGCHLPGSVDAKASGMKSPNQDCSRCHAPTSDKRPVHGIALFKGWDVCTACHESGMQNRKVNPTMDCGKCHSPGTKADVHQTFAHDSGGGTAPETPDHLVCSNCHGVPLGGHADFVDCAKCHVQ